MSAKMRQTPTAQRILHTLPIHSVVQSWGDTIHFETHVETGLEPDARDVIQPGEIAFWPDGDTIEIGFGRTPLSRGGEIRLKAPCNVWADAVGDVRQFASVMAGAQVSVSIAG